MSERKTLPVRPNNPFQRNGGDGDGPRVPDVKRPETNRLLERMKRVEPETARKYKQRCGQ